jgi:hypothetical protein
MSDESSDQDDGNRGSELLEGCGCVSEGCLWGAVSLPSMVLAVLWLGSLAWPLT